MVKKLFKYLTSREMITYVIAGLLTTLLNFLVAFLMFNIMNIDENITNAVAWIAAVVFAYFINNKWVFIKGNDNREGVKFIKFVGGRVFTLVVEVGATYIFVTRLEQNFWFIKVIIAVVVTVLNFLISKLYVFRKK